MLAAFQSVPQVPAEVTAVMAKSSDAILQQGVLGALLILSVIGNVVLVWLVIKVQNKRVEDTSPLHQLAEKMVATFTEVRGTIESLDDNSRSHAAATQALTQSVNSLLLSLLARAGIVPPLPPLPPPGNAEKPQGGM
jgi:uncharacterized protein HemX